MAPSVAPSDPEGGPPFHPVQHVKTLTPITSIGRGVAAPVPIPPDPDAWRPLYKPLLAFHRYVAEGLCVCQDKESRRIGPMIPTGQQLTLWQAAMWQASRGLPVRLVVPKDRQGGVSTLVQCLFNFLCGLFPNRVAMSYAQSERDTKSIFSRAKYARQGDVARYGDGDSTETGMSISWANGSTYECRTARSKSVSRGSTIDFMHLSEWASILTAGGLDADAATALLDCVPDSPWTIVIFESTGAPTGDFKDRCVQASRGIGSYRLVFLPWFGDSRNTRTAPPAWQPSEEARLMMSAHVLTRDQLYWWALKYVDRCQDGSNPASVARFKREHPTVLSDCFAAPAGLVYPMFGAGHVRHVDISGPQWRLYRSIDWGAVIGHEFATAWLAHDPTAPPGFSVEPQTELEDDGEGDNGTRHIVDEFGAYCRDAKTGKPLKKEDHLMSCARYVVMTCGLRGHIHVYRCYKDGSPPPAPLLARKLHEMSGWGVATPASRRRTSDEEDQRKLLRELGYTPRDPSPEPSDLSRWLPLAEVGELYEMTVADRARPDSLRDFSYWGLWPIIPSRKPKDSSPESEVEDGIFRIQSLLSGAAPLADKAEEDDEKVAQRVHDKLAGVGTAFNLPVNPSRAERRRMRGEDDPETMADSLWLGY